MTPSLLLQLVVNPTLAWLAPLGVRSDDRARVMLLAIAGQESEFRARTQTGNGPARGFWQFEAGGGVKGVLNHYLVGRVANAVCETLVVPATVEAVHPALAMNDALACAFARLLLYSDPKALPTDPTEGWNLYARTWRPGKPHPETWGAKWTAAKEAVRLTPC